MPLNGSRLEAISGIHYMLSIIAYVTVTVSVFIKIFAVSSHHFVEPLVLFVSDFGWPRPWVSKPGWMHHRLCSMSLVPNGSSESTLIGTSLVQTKATLLGNVSNHISSPQGDGLHHGWSTSAFWFNFNCTVLPLSNCKWIILYHYTVFWVMYNKYPMTKIVSHEPNDL